MRNAEVAHEWAHGRTARAGNMNCINGVLYSYHSGYVAAQLYDTPEGTVALFNENGYSPSTRQQIALARSAASHLPQFNVPEPEAGKHRGSHRHNADHLKEVAGELALKMGRARTNTEWYWEHHKAAVEAYNQYCRLFGIKRKEMEPLSSEAVRLQIDKQKVAAAKRKKKQDAAFAQHIKLWLIRHPDAPTNLWGPSTQYLRISMHDSEKVETSTGVTFPVEDARNAWKFIDRCYRHGTTYSRKGKESAVRLGNFVIDSINELGTIRAGCHTIERSEVERFAKLMNFS